MQIQFLHEINKPIIPAIGDIRILPSLEYECNKSNKKQKTPIGKIKVARCCKVLEHHVVYEIIGENCPAKAIPLELAESWGVINIDEAIKWILNSFMEGIIKESTKNTLESYSFVGNISEYYLNIENLVRLSRQVLKEADKAKNIYQRFIEKGAN